MTSYCSNCGKKLKNEDPKQTICIHGLHEEGSGIYIGEKDFFIPSPYFCSKECLCEYFSNALEAINPKCKSCDDSYHALCDDPRCPYVKEIANRKLCQDEWDRVMKRDGGFINHVVKTCKKFYLG